MTEKRYIEKCCIEGCNNDGIYLLSKIQGKVKIKKELIGTIPKDWKICRNDFNKALKEMKCCIEECNNDATALEIVANKLSEVKIKNDCCHRQLCTIHGNKYSYISNQLPVKREPLNSEQPPAPHKKQILDDDTVTESNEQNDQPPQQPIQQNENQQNNNDNSDTTTEVREEENVNPNPVNATNNEEVKVEENIKKEEPKEEVIENNKQESMNEDKIEDIIKKSDEKPVEPIKEEENKQEDHHCCIANCNSTEQREVPILQPLHVYICDGHLTEILKLWKISLLQQQVYLNQDCLNLIHSHVDENDKPNPFSNYKNPVQNDVKCALCCGLYSTDESYNCAFCPFTFCIECYKHLCLTVGTPQQFISNKAHWKCFVCAKCERDKMQRDVFIKQHLEKLLEIVKNKINDGYFVGNSTEELKEFLNSINE